MLSLRVFSCLTWFILSLLISIEFLVTGRGLDPTDNNILNSYFISVVIGLFALRLTHTMKRISLDSYLRLFIMFEILGGALSAIIIVTFRVDYSLMTFLVFNALFVSGICLVLLLARQKKLALGVFSEKTASMVAQYGAVNLVSTVRAAELGDFDFVVGNPLPTDDGDIRESLAMERLAMRGNVRAISTQTFLESVSGKVSVSQLPDVASSQLHDRLGYMHLKRLIDLMMSVLVLFLFFLFLTPLVILIKIDSPGPVFFEQKRLGFRGKIFTLYKFRTMTDDLDYASSLGSNDNHRITRVGKYLRKFRIDELPQVINVLRGEMSWIGPRPETLMLSKKYLRTVPLFRMRHIVRPGVTGWAQIHQGYTFGSEEFQEKVLYDLYYIKHFSLWLDLIIAVKTVAVILGGRGER